MKAIKHSLSVTIVCCFVVAECAEGIYGKPKFQSQSFSAPIIQGTKNQIEYSKSLNQRNFAAEQTAQCHKLDVPVSETNHPLNENENIYDPEEDGFFGRLSLTYRAPQLEDYYTLGKNFLVPKSPTFPDLYTNTKSNPSYEPTMERKPSISPFLFTNQNSKQELFSSCGNRVEVSPYGVANYNYSPYPIPDRQGEDDFFDNFDPIEFQKTLDFGDSYDNDANADIDDSADVNVNVDDGSDGADDDANVDSNVPGWTSVSTASVQNNSCKSQSPEAGLP